MPRGGRPFRCAETLAAGRVRVHYPNHPNHPQSLLIITLIQQKHTQPDARCGFWARLTPRSRHRDISAAADRKVKSASQAAVIETRAKASCKPLRACIKQARGRAATSMLSVVFVFRSRGVCLEALSHWPVAQAMERVLAKTTIHGQWLAGAGRDGMAPRVAAGRDWRMCAEPSARTYWSYWS